MAITGINSSWRQISGGVPKSSILDPALFNTFFNDLDDRAEHMLGKFADNIKLLLVVDVPFSCAAIERDLDRLKK